MQLAPDGSIKTDERQDLVAYGLDHTAVEIHADTLHDGKAAVDRGQCIRIPEKFVELGAAGNVREEDDEVARSGGHAEVIDHKLLQYKARS